MVKVTATVAFDVKVNSLLAPVPGLMTLENEFGSTVTSDGDVSVVLTHDAASDASQQIVAILILMDARRVS